MNVLTKKWNISQEGRTTPAQKVLLEDSNTKASIGGRTHYRLVNETITKNRGVKHVDVYVGKDGSTVITQERVKNGRVLPYNHLPVAVRESLVLRSITNPVKAVKKVAKKV